jgi:hypothetical protein
MTKVQLEQALLEEVHRCTALELRIQNLNRELVSQDKRLQKLTTALERIRDCDFVISLPDRMDAVRAIAREALEL